MSGPPEPQQPTDQSAESRVEVSLSSMGLEESLEGSLLETGDEDLLIDDEDAEDLAMLAEASGAVPIKKGRVLKSRRHLERARRRQMDYFQKRRKQKRMRIFYGQIRFVFKVCFAVLLAVLLWEMTQSPLWQYDKPRFALQNEQLLQSRQLAPFLQPLVGQPIYAIDTGELGRRIQAQYGIIEDIHVRRHMFPNRLELIIREKSPWARLYARETDRKPIGLTAGQDIVTLSDYAYHPTVYRGHPLANVVVTPASRLKRDFLRQLEIIVYQARHIPGLHFRWADVRNPKEVRLHFAETQLILGRLDNTASGRLARVQPLVPKIHEFKDDITAVDLRWEKQITFHQKPGVQLIKPEPEIPQ